MLVDDKVIETAWCHALAKRGRTVVYPPNSVIIHEGDLGEVLYFIVEGCAKVFSTNEEGKVIVYDRVGPGALLGEPILDGGTRCASVMTLERTTCIIIRAIDFKSIISDDPTLAMQVVFDLIRLIRASNELVKGLALDDVYGRVVRLLMKSAKDEGGRRVVGKKMTHQAIAERVGSSRERVGRIMRELERGRYLSMEHDAIVITRRLPTR